MIITQLLETSAEFRGFQRIFPLMNYSQFEQLQIIKQDGWLLPNNKLIQNEQVSLEQLLITNKFCPIEISSIVQTNDEGGLQLFHKFQPTLAMQMTETSNFYHFESQQHLSLQTQLLIDPSDILVNGHLLQMKQFNAFQSDCIPKIINSLKNFIILAPTSAGKTGVMSAVSLTYFNKGVQKIAYLAPLRALCQEIHATLKRIFGQINVGINTGDQQENLDAQIMVATYEKFNNYNEQQMKQFSVTYFDEIQLIGDRNRGWIIELLQIKLQKLSVRIIGFSGSFGNAEQLSQLLNATLLSYGDMYRPVQLTKNYLILKGQPNLYLKQQILQSELFKLIGLEAKEGPVLIFVASRKKVQYLALEYQKVIKTCSSNDSIDSFKCDSQYLLITLAKGVGFHHAGLSGSDKELVVSLFIKNRIQIVFATTTLAQGINLPARSIIIYQPYIFSSGNVSEITQQDIVQMEGRAGRPQFGQVGKSYVISDMKTKALEDITTKQLIEVRSNIGHYLLEFILQLLSIEPMQQNCIVAFITENTLFSKQFMNTQQTLYYFIQGQKMEIQLNLLISNCLSILSRLEIVQQNNTTIFKITQKGQLLIQFGITISDYISTLSFMQIIPNFDSLTNYISQLDYFTLKVSDSEMLELQELLNSFQFPITVSIKGKCSFLIQVLVQPINVQQALMQKLDITQNIQEFKDQLIRFLNYLLLIIPLQSQNALLYLLVNDLLFCIEHKVQLKGSFIQNYVGLELKQQLQNYQFINYKSESINHFLPLNIQHLSLQQIELLFQNQELYIVARQFQAVDIEEWYIQPLNELYYVLRIFFHWPTTSKFNVKLCVWDCDINRILWIDCITCEISKLSVLLNIKNMNIRLVLISISEIFLDSLAFNFVSEANFCQTINYVQTNSSMIFYNYPYVNSQDNEYLIDLNQNNNWEQVIKILTNKSGQTIIFKNILQFMQYQGGILEYLLIVCKLNNQTAKVFTSIPIENYIHLCTVFEMQADNSINNKVYNLQTSHFGLNVNDTTPGNSNFDLIKLFDKYDTNTKLDSSEIYILQHLNLESRLDVDFELILDILSDKGNTVNIDELMNIFSNSFFLTRLQYNKQYYKYTGTLDEEGISEFVSHIIEEVIEDKGFSINDNGFLC